MFYPWVPLQEHTHTLKHTHMHITAKATFVCVHAWVLTSCCALDAVWMILDPISHSLPTHIHCPATLASIPLVCHCVPMATYIYPTWLRKSADLSLVAAVGFGWQRKRSRNEQGLRARRRQSERLSVLEVVSIGDIWAQQSICLQLLGTHPASSAYALMLILPAMWLKTPPHCNAKKTGSMIMPVWPCVFILQWWSITTTTHRKTAP